MNKRLDKPQCYCGYHNNGNTLRNSASGGLGTALAEDIISRGGIVYGVIHSAGFHGAEYTRVLKPAELYAFRE